MKRLGLLFALLLLTLQGCGYKGDLYLPDEEERDGQPKKTQVAP